MNQAAGASNWFREGGIWQRAVAPNTWAFVRLSNQRFEVATGTNGKPDKWADYCDAKGGSFVQELKAKRRATALARKLIKGG